MSIGGDKNIKSILYNDIHTKIPSWSPVFVCQLKKKHLEVEFVLSKRCETFFSTRCRGVLSSVFDMRLSLDQGAKWISLHTISIQIYFIIQWYWSVLKATVLLEELFFMENRTEQNRTAIVWELFNCNSLNLSLNWIELL